MTRGTIAGWHYRTREAVQIWWEDRVITSIKPAATRPPEDLWIAPALVDLQINGFGGVDFQRDGLLLSDLLSAARQLREAGCAQFLFTLITDQWSDLIARLKHVRDLRSQSAELEAAIAGWHIEGPFLSPEPGFHGAHNPAVMSDPSPEQIRELRSATGTDPLLLTLAPERAGAIEAIALAVSLGIKVSLGHTDASAEVLRRAVNAGATGFTHLANGCPKALDRHDNILWRVFETEGLTVSVIPDQIHVSPPLFRLIHRVLAPTCIYYTTDAMSAAGAPPGRYSIGDLELEVGADQIVRQPGKTNFAGSALRPIEGIFRAARMLNRSWREVWDAFSAQPARLMGLTSGLESGQAANICLLKATEDNRLENLKVWARGESQN